MINPPLEERDSKGREPSQEAITQEPSINKEKRKRRLSLGINSKENLWCSVLMGSEERQVSAEVILRLGELGDNFTAVRNREIRTENFGWGQKPGGVLPLGWWQHLFEEMRVSQQHFLSAKHSDRHSVLMEARYMKEFCSQKIRMWEEQYPQ